MTINLPIVAVALFLILAVMFRSLRDSLLVMLSMPLAIASCAIALRVPNLFTTQAMDLLTTVGVLILLGLVVNNAIVLDTQARAEQRDGLNRGAAVAQAVRVRARPIYVSTLTSIVDMLPLMLMPGVDSQTYRGLATLIIGGMSVLALFTLILTPSVLDCRRSRIRCVAAQRTPEESPPIRKIILISILCLVAGAALAQPAMLVKVVQIRSVERTEIAPTIAMPGMVHSRNDVQVTAGVSRQLLSVAKPGMIVRQGEPVARIDTRALLLKRTEQEASLESANINIRRLESQLRLQRELEGSNLVSEFELEQTEANRDLAVADAKIIKVRIRQIDDQVRRADVLAPFTGIVISRAYRGGEDVARGEVLAQLTDITNMEVRAFVPLKHLPRTVVGDTINVFAADMAYEGRIRALVPTGDVRSQTFEAHIDLPIAATRDWTVGQLVSVAVPIRATSSKIAIPRDALVLRHNGQFVFRINDDNSAERVAVELGDSAGDLIAVSGALQAGDRVAVRGVENLRDGVMVKVMMSQSSGPATAATEG